MASIPMAVAGTISSGSAGKSVNLVLSASSISVGNLLRQLFSADGLVPNFLLSFVDPIKFQSVLITYNSAASGKSKLGIVAVPDLDGAPALKTIITTVGLDPTDLALRMGSSSLQFGLSKSFKLDLPAPFTGPGNATFSLALDSENKGAALAGSFAAALRINGVRDAVGLSVTASLSTTASNGVAISMPGATTTSIVIDGFSFIQIGTLTLAASVSPSPLMVHQLTLAGSVNMLGATGQAMFTFDKSSGALALAGEVANIDIQQMLRAVGVNVNLGEC